MASDQNELCFFRMEFPLKPGDIEMMVVPGGHALLVGLRSTVFGGSPADEGPESGKVKFVKQLSDTPIFVNKKHMLWA